jgi:acylglycerol lipase
MLKCSRILMVFLSVWVLGCAPVVYKPGHAITEPFLFNNRYITPDGAQLPFRLWLPEQNEIDAVLIALHGFNDYSHFFDQPGEFLKSRGVVSYAYDQRGFGGSPIRGRWSGINAYAEDLAVFIRLVKDKHPGLPVYLLGESMGGAVIIAAMARGRIEAVDGLILAAPAVWARETMPWYQRSLLWLLSHTMPWLTLTGKGLKVTASDNIDMLIALGRDPLVIKETRVEAIHGLTNLMDTAYSNARNIPVDTLVLYGKKDEVIPKKPTYRFLQKFLETNSGNKTVAFYEDGYHMILRDLQATVIWRDIDAWIKSSNTVLPSKADSWDWQLVTKNK